jgi:hypothetical protein
LLAHGAACNWHWTSTAAPQHGAHGPPRTRAARRYPCLNFIHRRTCGARSPKCTLFRIPRPNCPVQGSSPHPSSPCLALGLIALNGSPGFTAPSSGGRGSDRSPGFQASLVLDRSFRCNLRTPCFNIVPPVPLGPDPIIPGSSLLPRGPRPHPLSFAEAYIQSMAVTQAPALHFSSSARTRQEKVTRRSSNLFAGLFISTATPLFRT